jgi:hypothetical protein
MDNPHNANELLGGRVYDILLKMRFCGAFSESEIKDLCHATGVSINWPKDNAEHTDARLARIQRLIEAEQAELRG